jgi:twitching motility protein PilI
MNLDAFNEIELNLSNGLTMPQVKDFDILINAKSESMFGIQIASFGFLVSPSIYCEVLDKIHINALPNVNPLLSGVLNLRGNLVPVFDLQPLLKTDMSEIKKRRIISIDRGEKAVALWIDGFPEIIDKSCLQSIQQLPVVPGLLQRFVTRGYLKDDQLWLEAKFDDLFKSIGSWQFDMEEVIL